MPQEKILLIEGHAQMREQTRRIMEDAGYLVQAVASGAQAIDRARHETFDLLIADTVLPDLSGVQVFQQIRTIRPDIAGIVITGHSTWQIAMDALRAGFVGFLVKPVVPEQLLTSIVSALEQEKLRRENARLRALVPLYELSRAFMGTVELDDLLKQVVTIVRQETKAEVVSLMLADEDHRELRIAAADGLPSNVIETQKGVLGSGIAGRVAQTGEPVMIAEGVPLDPDIRQALGKPDILSALSLPLRARGQVIGVLNLSRMRGSEPFTPGDMELATVFASQAAIAIDKARLFNQLKQLSSISQRLARAVDLDEACNVVLNAPLELVNARGTALWLSEGELAPSVRSVGLDHLQIPSLSREKIAEEFRADADGGWLTVPLRRAEKIIGALIARLPLPISPSEERLGLLRTLADAAGAVIESHRLRARELLAFREVDRAVRADLNLKELLERFLHEMIGVCDAESGTIFRWDAERGHIEPWVTRGLAAHEEFARTIIRQGRGGWTVDQETLHYVIGAPMAMGTHAEGAVVLVRPATDGEFRSEQLDLLSTLASAAALSVRNAQLYTRSEEAAIAEERARIAREIHDGLAQDLSYLVLRIGAAQKLSLQGRERNLRKELSEIAEQLRNDMRDVRRLIFALRPLDIETQGFLQALQNFVRDFGQANEINVEFVVQGEANHLSPKLETALFRLTQEALNNIRKHAQAKHVRIDLSLQDRRFAVLRVGDDGRGFDLEPELQSARARGSVGLMQMRERAERAGGTFLVETAPGHGTRIQVQLPTREG